MRIGSDIENTTSGVDLLERLCKYAAEKGFTTGFLGGGDGIAKQTAECLLKKYPKLKVFFAGSDTETKIPPVDLLFVAEAGTGGASVAVGTMFEIVVQPAPIRRNAAARKSCMHIE